MNKEKLHLSLGLGVPTILFVFIILCMCILSVLTYINASSNDKGWQKEKEHMIAYYQADTKAKQIVNALEKKVSMDDIQNKYEIKIQKEATNYLFQVIIKEDKKLSVILNEDYKILRWQTIREE